MPVINAYVAFDIGARIQVAAVPPGLCNTGVSLAAQKYVAKLGARGALDLHGSSTSLSARGRALVACLAVEHGLCSAATVARHFHRAKATLSEQMTACRASVADRQILRTPVQRVVNEAVALLPATR